MRRTVSRLVVLVAAAGAVAACHAGGTAPGAATHGRYAGVGVYSPGEPWTRIAAAAQSSPSAAQRLDDQAVIVTVDSQTGDVRACGDLSGYCVGFNPWRNPAGLAPVLLTGHVVRSADAPAAR